MRIVITGGNGWKASITIKDGMEKMKEVWNGDNFG